MSSEPVRGRVPVNIVMRTRNRPLLLARALEDVLAQTSDAWTLTVINDGGDRAVVDDLVAERQDRFAGRVDVLHNPRSRGMEAASNQAVGHVESEFVAVHDDDDTWAPDFLAATTVALEDDLALGAVAVRTEIVWEEVFGARVVERAREIFLPARRDVTLTDLLRFNSCVPISMLYRRDRLTDIGLFDESLTVTGDWEANVRLAARYPIGYLGDATRAFWHQRRDSSGDLGNSVITLGDDHRRFDRHVRDRELRAWVQENGTGLPLYLTRFTDDRFDEMRERLDDTLARLDRIERMLRRWPFEMVKSAVRRILPGRRP